MRTVAASILGLALIVAAGAAVSRSFAAGTQASAPPAQATKADVERWKKELSNWGRWGKENQLGSINLITPSKRKQAAALVRDGIAVSLSHDAETDKAVDKQLRSGDDGNSCSRSHRWRCAAAPVRRSIRWQRSEPQSRNGLKASFSSRGPSRSESRRHEQEETSWVD